MCIVTTRHGSDIQGESFESEIDSIEDFLKERKRQFEVDPPRGLRHPESAPSAGWQCPNCGRAHGPEVSTCPEPPKGKGLRDRIGSIHNG
jgi:hypothetical protein